MAVTGDNARTDAGLAGLPAEALLDRLASRDLPGGGGGAALSTATAAALTEMAAGLAGTRLPDAGRMAARASGLRRDALRLLETEAYGYQRVLEARRGLRHGEVDAREHLLAALTEASQAPLALADLAARTAVLAARLARSGNPAVFGDAAAGALGAAAAARSAAVLVAANLGSVPGGERHIGRAGDLAGRAAVAERLVLSLRVPAVPVPVHAEPGGGRDDAEGRPS